MKHIWHDEYQILDDKVKIDRVRLNELLNSISLYCGIYKSTYKYHNNEFFDLFVHR